MTLRIHSSSNSTGCFRLVATNVLFSEQELSVKIADFNVVIICNKDLSVA